MIRPVPFKVAIPDALLQDLKVRLANTRWPDEPKAAGWNFGTNLSYMKRLIDYWNHSYNWRKAEAEINKFAQYTAPITTNYGETIKLHFIHEIGSGENPLPLLIMHGWPGSIAEFLHVIEPLAHPERFGGNAQDAFNIIAPSLPGYGFSSIPKTVLGPQATAEIMSNLMRKTLGYSKFLVQGGDWGSVIGMRMALEAQS